MVNDLVSFFVELDDWFDGLPPRVRSAAETVALRDRAVDLVAQLVAQDVENAFDVSAA